MIGRHERLSLLFIIDFIDTLAGGTENQLLRIINNLDTNKFDINLVCLRGSSWIRENAGGMNCQTKVCRIYKLKDPFNVVRSLQLLQHIRRVSPDIVVTMFPLSNILGVVLARLAGVSVIVSTRRDYGLWLKKWSRVPLQIANRYVNRIVTNSRAVKLLVASEEGYPSDQIDVIYNGIDAAAFEHAPRNNTKLKKLMGIPQGNRVVGIVGGLKPMKNHSIFIRAAKEVLGRRQDVDFVIVGDGVLRTQLQREAAQCGIADRVWFAGTQGDVGPYVAMFDIAVNCSSNEGLSNAIMEYMALGIPSIVSRAGGNTELIEDGIDGYCFTLGDYHELAEKTVRLLDDNGVRREFACRSKEKIRSSFSLETMIQAYEDYFFRIGDQVRKEREMA